MCSHSHSCSCSRHCNILGPCARRAHKRRPGVSNKSSSLSRAIARGARLRVCAGGPTAPSVSAPRRWSSAAQCVWLCWSRTSAHTCTQCAGPKGIVRVAAFGPFCACTAARLGSESRLAQLFFPFSTYRAAAAAATQQKANHFSKLTLTLALTVAEQRTGERAGKTRQGARAARFFCFLGVVFAIARLRLSVCVCVCATNRLHTVEKHCQSRAVPVAATFPKQLCLKQHTRVRLHTRIYTRHRSAKTAHATVAREQNVKTATTTTTTKKLCLCKHRQLATQARPLTCA